MSEAQSEFVESMQINDKNKNAKNPIKNGNSANFRKKPASKEMNAAIGSKAKIVSGK